MFLLWLFFGGGFFGCFFWLWFCFGFVAGLFFVFGFCFWFFGVLAGFVTFGTVVGLVEAFALKDYSGAGANQSLQFHLSAGGALAHRPGRYRLKLLKGMFAIVA